MKIDFEALEKLEAAGATARIIINVLRQQSEAEKVKREAKGSKEPKKKPDLLSVPTSPVRDEAAVVDSPRSRLFREGTEALIALNIKESRARALIGTWLKVTRDDEQLVTATILRALSLSVADAPGWILSSLQHATGAVNGQPSYQNRTFEAAGRPKTGQDAIYAGMARIAAKVAVRIEAEERERKLSDGDDPAAGFGPRLI